MEPEQRCMTDHRIKNNPLSSFENKQRSVSNISYMVFTRRFVQGAAQSLPRVVCPYALSNLCQRLKTKNLVKIRLLKGNLI
jgi:hypothetical protein